MIEQVDLDALEAIAKDAALVTTGNGWVPDLGGIVLDPDDQGNSWDGTIVCEVPSAEDANRQWHLREYIAAANPAAVLALISELRSATEAGRRILADATAQAEALRAELRQETRRADAIAQVAVDRLNELRQERERAAELEGAYNSAVERHRLAAEKRDEYQQLYGDMADDERRARVALRRAEERADEAESRVAFAAAIVSGDAVFDRYQELDEALATLSRAEEAIEKVRNLPRHEINVLVTAVDAHGIDAILSDYDKQKGADRGRP